LEQNNLQGANICAGKITKVEASQWDLAIGKFHSNISRAPTTLEAIRCAWATQIF
jgi:hypothetical protein